MRTTTCPTCGTVASYTDDAGPLQCPTCGEDLAPGGWDGGDPGRPPDPGGSLPPGVRSACAQWVVCGYVGQVLSVAMVPAAALLQVVGPCCGFLVLNAGLSVAAYRVSVHLARAVRRREETTAHFAGWVGLVQMAVLLVLGGFLALGVVVGSAQPPPEVPNNARLRYLVPSELAFVILPAVGFALALVNLVLVRGSLLFLWHSGEAAHADEPPAEAFPGRPAFPGSVRFAGWAWVVLAVLGVAQAALTAWLLPGLDPNLAALQEFRVPIGLLVALPSLLLTLPFGVLLLAGRLPGTAGPSLLFVAFALLGVALTAATARAEPAAWVVTGVGTAASLAASVAGLVGDRAYRRWLRGW